MNTEEASVIIYLREVIKYTNHSKRKAKLIKELNQLLDLFEIFK